MSDPDLKTTPDAPLDAFILWYEDPDQPQEMFSGHGAVDVAYRRYQQQRGSWSCHLFRCVLSSVRAGK
jgi:hypothetical protein